MVVHIEGDIWVDATYILYYAQRDVLLLSGCIARSGMHCGQQGKVSARQTYPHQKQFKEAEDEPGTNQNTPTLRSAGVFYG